MAKDDMEQVGKVVMIGGGLLFGGMLVRGLLHNSELLVNELANWSDPLLVPSGIAIGLGAATVAGVKAYQLRKKEEVTAIQITPAQDMKVHPERVGAMVKEFRQLHASFLSKRVWITWRITRDERGQFQFQVITPTKHAAVVQTRIRNAYPQAVIQEAEAEFIKPTNGESAHVKLRGDKAMGLNANLDNHMGDILSLMPHGAVMEITLSPDSIKPIRRRSRTKIKTLEKKRGKDYTELIEDVRQRYKGNRTAFEVFIDVWGSDGIEAFLGEISAKTEGRNKLRGEPHSLEIETRAKGLNGLYRILSRYWNTIGWDKRLRTMVKWQSSLLTDRELANLFFFPALGHPVWESIHCSKQKPKVLASDFQGSYGIGYIDSENPKENGRVARLKTDTLTNHALIAGASGGGKGSTLMMLFKQDFVNKWLEDKLNSLGVTIGDPHTEDIYLMLSHLLDLEAQGVKIPWHRVKAISFGEIGARNYPVSANLLHLPQGADEITIDQIATDTEEVILSAFDSSALSQSASYLKKAIQGLLYYSKVKPLSLLDVVRMFEYNAVGSGLRMDVMNALKGGNERVREWWEKTNAEIEKKEQDMKVSAIDTRLAPLLDSKSMQRFFCREDNYFEAIPEWIEKGYLIMIDFKGAVPEMNKLCAAWLAKQYFTASQARGTGGRPHLLIFDEVQKFDASEIFLRILTENRKFNMGLVLVTQMVEALDKELKQAVKSNAGAVISVRQEDGAADMAQLLGHPFTADELRTLEKGLEARIRSFDGKARIKLEYPSYMLNGQATQRESDEETEAKNRAKAKFMELLSRDHKTAKEADEEIRQFVYGSTEKQEEAKPAEKQRPNPMRRIK